MARTAKRYKDEAKMKRKKEVESFHVGIYSRLSVDNHDRKIESIENQIEIIRQFIQSNNLDPHRKMHLIPYDTYIDRGISGTSFERAGFERLLQDVKEHKVTCIIVKDLSRFGRDYVETGDFIEKILPFLNCRFIAVADHYDSMAENVNESKMVMNIKNLVNDMYAKDISKRVATVRKMSARAGSFIGSFAPYGYEIVCTERVRKLQINEQCAQVVKKIFTLYSQGFSRRDIIGELYNEKVHKISDYKKYGHVYCVDGEVLHQWGESSIQGILHNSNYLGNLEQCKSKSGLCGGKKGIICVDKEEWVTVQNTHPAIIHKELFEIVQKRDHTAKNHKKGEYKDTENIYRNVIYCGNCGKRMHATFYQSRIKEERKFSYLCRNAYRMDERKCGKNYIKEELISLLVIEEMRMVFERLRMKSEDFIKLNMEEYERKVAQYEIEEKKICKEWEYVKKQAGIKYGQYKEGTITREEYDTFKRNKKEQDIYTEKRLGELKRKIEKAKEQAEEENKFLCSLLKAGKNKQLNIQLVEALIEKVTIFPDGRMDILYKFLNGE